MALSTKTPGRVIPLPRCNDSPVHAEDRNISTALSVAAPQTDISVPL